MKKELLKLKGDNAVTCYLPMLQNNIARMSNHSGIVKASICVIYTVLITLLLSLKIIKEYWWVMVLATLLGAILDSYYLAMEKTYVDKYDSFIENLNNGKIDVEKIYNLKPRTTSLKCELLARIFGSLLSFSVIGFYGILIAISVLIALI